MLTLALDFARFGPRLLLDERLVLQLLLDERLVLLPGPLVQVLRFELRIRLVELLAQALAASTSMSTFMSRCRPSGRSSHPRASINLHIHLASVRRIGNRQQLILNSLNLVWACLIGLVPMDAHHPGPLLAVRLVLALLTPAAGPRMAFSQPTALKEGLTVQLPVVRSGHCVTASHLPAVRNSPAHALNVGVPLGVTADVLRELRVLNVVV
eukprot:CAMPEP_0203973444 /NCGR_PEP_ID=MMETSP0359-20131031/99593_1 /ASSEMBLY_ACC=CAM_ASM_000338 /TAXON_ID=268821 /ORGANISM="Scrippsiella Hangoei, Strain SHTV-5" /LENGTH=210 /DNA_ID=CAMNT_0050911603 /DNA_START=158 /DNA_END=791 /DNA_ORIENTATION=+